jgi:hypothetical protein
MEIVITNNGKSKIVICVSRQQVHLFRPSLGFLAEAQPRLETGKDKRHFLGEVHIKISRQQ